MACVAGCSHAQRFDTEDEGLLLQLRDESLSLVETHLLLLFLLSAMCDMFPSFTDLLLQT